MPEANWIGQYSTICTVALKTDGYLGMQPTYVSNMCPSIAKQSVRVIGEWVFGGHRICPHPAETAKKPKAVVVVVSEGSWSPFLNRVTLPKQERLLGWKLCQDDEARDLAPENRTLD
jgi:hypothetical protein